MRIFILFCRVLIQIVVLLVVIDARRQRGLIFARGLAGAAVPSAAASRLELLATTKPVPAITTSPQSSNPPERLSANVLEYFSAQDLLCKTSVCAHKERIRESLCYSALIIYFSSNLIIFIVARGYSIIIVDQSKWNQ